MWRDDVLRIQHHQIQLFTTDSGESKNLFRTPILFLIKKIKIIEHCYQLLEESPRKR